MGRICKPVAASVVNKDDMHFSVLATGLAEMTRVSGARLSRPRAAEHPLEYCQGCIVGDDLLESYGRYLKLRQGSGHVGIAFIGAYYDVSGGRDAEIGTCHARVCAEEFASQAQAGHVCQIAWIMIARLVR